MVSRVFSHPSSSKRYAKISISKLLVHSHHHFIIKFIVFCFYALILLTIISVFKASVASVSPESSLLSLLFSVSETWICVTMQIVIHVLCIC